MHTPLAILFDLDDTLWPIAPVIARAETAMYAWLEQHAPAVAAAHTIATLRQRRSVLMASNARYRYDMWALRLAALHEVLHDCGEDPTKAHPALEVFSAARNQVEPYADVLPALARLGQRYALGSVSNGAADLRAIGMAHHFRVSIAAHRFGQPKPEPAIFLHACAKLGVAPEQAVYVGDDPLLDVAGAQGAGLAGVWMKRADASLALPEAVRPDAICASLNELEAWLNARA